LLDEPQIEAIRSIRQICSAFKKVKLECSSRRKEKAFEEYCRIDNEMASLIPSIPSAYNEGFEEVAAIMWSTVFGKRIDYDDLIPHHGPGSTAEAITGNRKYVAGSYSWPKRLDTCFTAGNIIYSSEENMNLSKVDLDYISVGEELPVRVIQVPKTLKTPRIIAMEPLAMQATQQSIKDYMVRKLETNPLTAGHVNFSDQSINKGLALQSSRTRNLATLDLSAASDRVHKVLVSRMLKVNPELSDLVFTTRSPRALVHEKLILLNKFASMGSALCFPIEAMFFTTVIILARLRHKNLPVTLPNIRYLMRDTYVYGDDIIIPVDEVDSVIDTLRLFGNVASRSKSFWKGRFRESCGMDAYDGREITPTYIRQLLPNRKRETAAVISTVSAANQFYKKGFTHTALYLVKTVHAVLGQKLPRADENCGGLGWDFNEFDYSPDLFSKRSRFNPRLQRVEVRTLAVNQVLKKDKIDGYNALTKCLLKLVLKKDSVPSGNVQLLPQWDLDREILNEFFFRDPRHLDFSPKVGALTLKHRWVAPL
jgi:hypothetical protein